MVSAFSPCIACFHRQIALSPPLTIAEIVVSFVPVLLPVCVFVVFKKRRQVGASTFEDSNLPEQNPEYIPLLATRSFWTFFCVLVGFAATWALGNAVWDAIQMGEVSLPGRRGHPRPVVPWVNAWAYLLGLSLMAGALLGSRWLKRSGANYTLYALGLTIVTCLGYVLFFLSRVLSSLTLTGLFVCAVGSAAGVLYVDRKYGRIRAFILGVAAVTLFVWLLRIAV